MPAADGKLYAVFADEICRRILRALVPAPLTQTQLAAKLVVNSSTISRRIGELEAVGLVTRSTPHAPCELLFPEQTHEHLVTGADLLFRAVDRQAQLAAEDLRDLKDEAAADRLTNETEREPR